MIQTKQFYELTEAGFLHTSIRSTLVLSISEGRESNPEVHWKAKNGPNVSAAI